MNKESEKNIKICTLGSGSKGNSFVISNNYGEAIVIDAGFSCRKMLEKISLSGISINSIKAVLLTHDHDDHAAGCKVFCNKLDIPLYTTFETAKYLEKKDKLPKQVIQFEAGESFAIGNFSINAFAVQHDAIDPVGFTIHCDDRKVGIATDLGTLNKLCCRHLCDCHALVLESNYDREMLYNSDRTLSLKRRISGSSGHLDNAAAADALGILLGDRTQFLMLVHVSGECNSPEIIDNLTVNSLKNLQKEHVKRYIACQNDVSEWFEI